MIRERGERPDCSRRHALLPAGSQPVKRTSVPGGVGGFRSWIPSSAIRSFSERPRRSRPPPDQRVACAQRGRSRDAGAGLSPRTIRPNGVSLEHLAIRNPRPWKTSRCSSTGLVVRRGADVADQQGFFPDCPENVSDHTMTSRQGFRMPAPDPLGFGPSHARLVPQTVRKSAVGRPIMTSTMAGLGLVSSHLSLLSGAAAR